MDTISDDCKCIVVTSDGPICGYIIKTEEGTYYKFKSIPYATPPLGHLRFMPPVVVKPWTHLLDCTQDAPIPLSLNLVLDYDHHKVVGSEDCLYIEVTSPNIKPDKLMPVMFWIGTYNYVCLCDDLLDPTLIVNQGIVIIRCGFRLGPMGFLSNNEFTAPGNMGLKDVVMALKWVQRNVEKFGGDPTNVTLFGSSTGGSTVHFMILSPMATGLFQKAIIQSSTALNRWSLAKNPTQAVTVLAKELGITKTDKYEIVEELKATPASDIMKAFSKLMLLKNVDETAIFDAIFKPCIEREYEGQPAFLSKNPSKILKSGNFNKVPIIIGSNNNEAAVLQFFVDKFYEDFEKFNKDISLLVPKFLAVDSNVTKKIGEQLLNFYFKGNLNEHTRTQYLQLLSDFYFLFYVNKTVRMHSKFGPECPIYYYIVNYQGEWNVPKELDFFNSSGHSAELSYLFRIINKSGNIVCKGSRDSVKTRSRVVKMWTNFAKYGNPTPDDNDPLLQITWDPVADSENLNYLSIGSELTKGRNPFYDRMLFWEQLHDEHMFIRTIVYFNEIGVSF